MDYTDPIIGVSASSLKTVIEEHRKAQEVLIECDREWRDERDKHLDALVELRAGLADVLGIPFPLTITDPDLVEHVRQALALTTVTVPARTVVLDHDSAKHAMDSGLLDHVSETLQAAGLDSYKHDPGAPPVSITVDSTDIADAFKGFSFSVEDVTADTVKNHGRIQTLPAPWHAGDIIRYSDDQGPIVDGELVMRERDEGDTTWVAKIVYVHQKTTCYNDDDEPYMWKVDENVYPIEGDERFTKILDGEDKPWAVNDLIEHRGGNGLIFRARITAPDPHERDDNWSSAVVTELVQDPRDGVGGPSVGQTLLLRQRPGGPNVRVGGLETASPAAPVALVELGDPAPAEPAPAEVLNPFTQLDQQPTALNLGWRAGDGPCDKCQGERQVANSDDQEPWSFWENLPPGSDLAVKTGIVQPIPCPECSGQAADNG